MPSGDGRLLFVTNLTIGVVGSGMLKFLIILNGGVALGGLVGPIDSIMSVIMMMFWLSIVTIPPRASEPRAASRTTASEPRASRQRAQTPRAASEPHDNPRAANAASEPRK